MDRRLSVGAWGNGEWAKFGGGPFGVAQGMKLGSFWVRFFESKAWFIFIILCRIEV